LYNWLGKKVMADYEDGGRLKLLTDVALGTEDQVDNPRHEIADLSTLEPLANAVMEDLMLDVDPEIRLKAADSVLDRVGKPKKKDGGNASSGKTIILNFPPSAVTDAIKGMSTFLKEEIIDVLPEPPTQKALAVHGTGSETPCHSDQGT
jgi:hypothetical protein